VLVSIAGSVLVVGLVTWLVLAFAVIPVPEYPSLTESPDDAIAGTVAFVRWENGSCLYTVPAAGGPDHEVMCTNGGDLEPRWTPDGMLVVTQYDGGPGWWLIVDPATGREIERIRMGDEAAREFDRGYEAGDIDIDGATVFSRGDGGNPTIVIQSDDGTEREVVSLEGPRDYRIDSMIWSPDGRWILFTDSEERLLVVSVTGESRPRILAEDVSIWPWSSWYIPGYDHGTWDPREPG
jgi:hypothetical protein